MTAIVHVLSPGRAPEPAGARPAAAEAPAASVPVAALTLRGGAHVRTDARSDAPLGSTAARRWPASLSIRFRARDGRTVLADNRHAGPLRLLKSLDADDGGCAHAVIVHPPGGLAAGDSLAVECSLDAGAHVLATTPGAQKWYRGAASARTRLQVAPGACLEWLPMASIAYDGAEVDQSLVIELARGAATIGGECMILGRRAMGERFERGRLRQSIRIDVDGRPLWHERTDAAAGAALFDSPAGWHGRVACASIWAVGAGADDALVDAWRAELDAACAASAVAPPAAGCAPGAGTRLLAGATRPLDGLVLAKLLGDDATEIAAVVQRLWALARPAIAGQPARTPRIWAT